MPRVDVAIPRELKSILKKLVTSGRYKSIGEIVRQAIAERYGIAVVETRGRPKTSKVAMRILAILRMVEKHGCIRASDVQRELSLSHTQAYYALQLLANSGALRRVDVQRGKGASVWWCRKDIEEPPVEREVLQCLLSALCDLLSTTKSRQLTVCILQLVKRMPVPCSKHVDIFQSPRDANYIRTKFLNMLGDAVITTYIKSNGCRAFTIDVAKARGICCR